MAASDNALDPSTLVVSLGRPPRADGASLNPAISLTATYVGVEAPGEGNRGYARFSNETWEALEAAIAVLEGADAPGLAFASGMAAIAATLSLVPVGGVAVVPTSSYGGSIGLARTLANDGVFVLREVDPTNIDATIAALDGADLLWLESPTNPLLDVIDLPRLIAAAHERGALVAVDNTFSTPLRQRPLEHGADVVVHSATKFIAGHSDVLLGLVIAKDPAVRERLLARRTLTGGIPGPFEAWLALRGLRTLALRLDRAEQTAGILAVRLAEASVLTRVRYPGLASDPGHELATRLLDGYGAIISIEFSTTERAQAFVAALKLITPATSLGGVETLAERRRRHSEEPKTVPESLVRLSIGIEHPDDLWADIAQALAQL